MYYDRFGRSTTQHHVHASTPQLPPLPPRRPLATRAPRELLKAYLDAHRTVWHLESLQELFPEIVTYLDSRYHSAQRDGGLCVRAIDGAYPDVDFDHSDLRIVAEYLLSREYRRALVEECINPSIERLSA